jgi:hypothetical protein
MKLTEYVTLNLNINMSAAGVFLDIDKVFHTKWHYGLLYKFSELGVWTGFINLISSVLTDTI